MMGSPLGPSFSRSPAGERSTGWATSTTSREDIKKSLHFAMEKILDSTLNSIRNDEMVCIVSAETFRKVRCILARMFWKYLYSKCRKLGDRDRAFRVIGSKRRMIGLQHEDWRKQYADAQIIIEEPDDR